MDKIELQTVDGVLVTYAVLPFDTVPDAVIWGHRTFLPWEPWSSSHKSIYREVLPVRVTTPDMKPDTSK